jgi:hypothetical protein
MAPMSALPPDLGDLRAGTIAVHNDVPETPLIGRPGFQWWTESEGALPRELCDCGEVPRRITSRGVGVGGEGHSGKVVLPADIGIPITELTDRRTQFCVA